MRTLRFDVAPSAVVTVLASIAGVYLVTRVWGAVLMLVVALVLAGTINPIVRHMERRRVPRALALGALFAAATLLLVVFALVTVPPLIREFVALASQAPATQSRAADWLASHETTRSLADNVRGARAGPVVASLGRRALELTPRVLEGVAYCVTTLFLALYLVADRERLRGAFFSLVPRRYHVRTARVVMNLESIVGGYVRGQLITSLAMGVFAFALLTALRVPNALALAALAAAFDALPLVGGVLATAPAVAMALQRGPGVAVAVGVSMALYQEFENRVVVPRVYGKTLRLPPAAVVVALFAGAQLMGVLGALLALPFAAAIQMLVHELRLALPGEADADPGQRALDLRAEAEYARRTKGCTAQHAAAVATAIAEAQRAAGARREGVPPPDVSPAAPASE